MLDALGFLTIAGRSRPPTRAVVVWFGPVGALIGAALGALWWGATNVWPAPVAAAIVVVADLAVTGLLHVDGLADSADGLLPHLDRDRRLAVMATPDVGAFGVAVVAGALLLRFAALSATDPDGWKAVAFLAAVWCASRALMAVTMTVVPYARDAGLASSFLGGAALAPVLAAVPFVALGVVRGIGGAVALAAGVVAGCLVVALARRRLGGFTGDVLGAAGVVTETVALVVMSARW
jgi:adenosylcobinamide-GDP ribazoletransferase